MAFFLNFLLNSYFSRHSAQPTFPFSFFSLPPPFPPPPSVPFALFCLSPSPPLPLSLSETTRIMACDDEAEWLATAMTDDSTVAELLLRIQSAGAPPHAAAAAAAAARALKLDWTVRQRRSSNSKTAPKEPGRKKRGGEPARASPTTPLSWSGATSTSGGGGGGGGGGGDEECSGVPVVKSPEKARSKTTNGSTTTSAATPSKRPRKKKTLAELREEENKLLKERRRLRWGLANLRRVVEKQRLANESLKKMKLDTQCKREAETTPEEQPLNVSSCTPCSSASKTCKVETCERLFELPDLNLPVEGSG
ncbi:uncharacterized protein LOC115689090 [Syzygium oleosum]|uniref:uncharacterized protein LOC115689090 n=1 Tax=Syzygium oleosum TaxID=219896 RepID=UPI0024B9111A|nr:uncharacterized protein LOC115689090 [Syzygium oleosum]